MQVTLYTVTTELVFVLSVCCASSLFIPGTIALSAEKRLIKDLIETYKQAGVVGRPVQNVSEKIDVIFGLSLIQILSLDEKNQVLTINTWNQYNWRDYLLSWNESEYEGIKIVRVPPEDIWKPDVVLYNYADDRLEEKRRVMVLVASDGTVTWIPPAIYKSSCSIDITNFPFDSQVCSLKFGSWTYDGFKVDLFFYQDIPEVSLKDYVPSNEWDIIGHPARKNVERYNCCPEPYIDLTFTIVLRRKAAFYNYILILPCVLLSLLTMVLFWLPPESPAKMQLGMNIFVAFFVLLLLLSGMTPKATSSTPLLGAYYCMNMVMITISTFLAVLVIHLTFRGPRTNKVPNWLKKFVLAGLARVVCMMNYVPKEKPSHYDILKNKDPKLKKEFKKFHIQELKHHKFLAKEPLDGAECTCNNTSTLDNGQMGPQLSHDMSPLHLHNHSLQADVKEIRKTLKLMVLKKKNGDDLEKMRGEWRAVALVLDRLFFFIYVSSIIVSLALMFPRTSA